MLLQQACWHTGLSMVPIMKPFQVQHLLQVTGASFGTGVKGQALTLNNGYLVFPTIAKLSGANAFPSVSVSCWVNTDNRDSLASSVFCITKALSCTNRLERWPGQCVC